MVFGYEINDQKVFFVYLIPSMNGHHYHIVNLKKTLISYSPLIVPYENIYVYQKQPRMKNSYLQPSCGFNILNTGVTISFYNCGMFHAKAGCMRRDITTIYAEFHLLV